MYLIQISDIKNRELIDVCECVSIGSNKVVMCESILYYVSYLKYCVVKYAIIKNVCKQGY